MNLLFARALAESAAAQLTEGEAQALAAGAALGASAGMLVAFGIVYFILSVIADWKIFTKAGEAGWKSIIPVLSDYTEYGICWKSSLGLSYGVGTLLVQFMSGGELSTVILVCCCVLSVLCLVLHCVESIKLAKAFGKGMGFGIGLILLAPIFRLILGFGGARYIGKPAD